MLLVWVMILAIGAGTGWAATEKVLPDGSKVATFSVPDMECAMCSHAVSTEVKKVAGVQEARFDDLNRLAIVKYDPAAADAKKIQQAIKRAGFACKQVDTK